MWKQKLEHLAECGLLEYVPQVARDILVNGDDTKFPIWEDDAAFSMPIQKYLELGGIVGGYENQYTQNSRKDIFDSVDPKAPGRIIIVKGRPNVSLLHRLGSLLNLPPDLILGHYNAVNWLPIRSIPSRRPRGISIRIVSVGSHKGEDNMSRLLSDIQIGRFGRMLCNENLGTDIFHGLDPFGPSHKILPNLCCVEQHLSFLTYHEGRHDWSGILLSDCGSRSQAPIFSPTEELRFYPWPAFSYVSRPNPLTSPYTSQSPKPFAWRVGMDEAISHGQREYCQEDPFAFLADLLDTSALSWTILLSYLQNGPRLEDDRPSDTLRTEKAILDRAYAYFTDILEFLEVDRHTMFTAKCSEVTSREEVDKISARLSKDFEFLRREAESLSRDRLESINILMSKMSIRESQKGLEDARRVRLVTYLAFVFIPLSFISSVFGMNVHEFSDPGPGIWLFFATAVPLTLASLGWPVWLEFSEEIKNIPEWFAVWLFYRLIDLGMLLDLLRNYFRRIFLISRQQG